MKRFFVAMAIALLCSAAHAHDPNIPLDTYQKQFLAQYELMRAALANDDLDGAKEAAAVVADNPALQQEAVGADAPHGFVKGIREFLDALSIEEARNVFKTPLTFFARKFTDNTPGYYYMACPLPRDGKGDWVQTTTEIGNPYQGKTEHPCGRVIRE